MVLCGVAAVPKGSELLENTVARLSVLLGPQQWLGLPSLGPISSGQTRQPWCVTKAAPMVWLKSFPAA